MNFCILIPCHMSQEPSRNCSDKLLQMNFCPPSFVKIIEFCKFPLVFPGKHRKFGKHHVLQTSSRIGQKDGLVCLSGLQLWNAPLRPVSHLHFRVFQRVCLRILRLSAFSCGRPPQTPNSLFENRENPHFPRFRLERPDLQNVENPINRPYFDRH